MRNITTFHTSPHPPPPPPLHNINFSCATKTTLLENLTDDAIAQLYVTKFSTISLYVTELYVTKSFAISVISQIQRNPPKLC